MTTEIATAYVGLLPSMDGFGSKMSAGLSSQIRGSGKTLGSSFGKVFAAAAAVGIGAKAFDFLKGSVGAASDLNETLSKSQTIFGKYAKDMEDWAERADTSLGLSKQAALELTANFANMFDQIGFGGQQAKSMSIQVANLAADLGSFNNLPTADVTDRISAAFRGEYDSIQALIPTINAASVEQKALAMTGKDSADALTAQEKAAATMALVVKGAGPALNDFSKTSGGLANQQKILAAQWENTKSQLGQALLPVVTKVVTAFNNELLPAFSRVGDFAATVGKAFEYLFNGGDEGVRGFAEILDSALGNTGRYIDPIVQVTGVLKTVLETAVKVRSEVGERLAPVFEKLGGFLRDNPEFVKAFAVALGALVGAISAVTLATTLFSIVLNTTGIPLVVIAIAALVAGLVVAYQKSETFRNIVQQVGAVLKEVGAGLVEFGNWIKTNVIPVVVQLAQKVAANLQPILKQLAETFQNQILPTVQRVIAKFREWQPTIQQVAGVVIRLVAQWVDFVTTIAGKVLPVVIKLVGIIISKVVPAVLNYVEAVAKIIGKLIDFGKKVVDAAQKVGEFAKKVGQKVAQVIDFFTGMARDVRSVIDGLVGDMLEKGRQLVGNLVAGIKEKIGDAVDAVKDLAGSVAGFFHGSPVKTGPLVSWNNGGAGKRLVDSLIDGIVDRGPAMVSTMVDTVTKLTDLSLKQLEKMRDGIKDRLSQMRDDFASLRDAIASAFAPDLFQATSLADFIKQGREGFGMLQALKDALKKLKKMKVSQEFINSLFESGNTELILDLAAGSAHDVQNAEWIWNQDQSLANQLGMDVAGDTFGKGISRLERRLDRVVDAIKHLPKDIGKEVNGVASDGHRRRATV